MVPQTRYARSGPVNIAYQVVGDGPFDLVFVPGWVSHVELAWEDPDRTRFLRRLASFSRLIIFDKRGTGLSDHVPDDQLPTLETRMDDVRAVMDAVGSQRAALFGFSEGGNMSMLYAATYPQRTIALVAYSCFAKRIWSPDYPWAPTPEARATASSRHSTARRVRFAAHSAFRKPRGPWALPSVPGCTRARSSSTASA